MSQQGSLTEYIIRHFRIPISVPGEILKICEIVLEDWKGRGTWGNTGSNCKKLYPQVLGDQQRKVRILDIEHLKRGALWRWASDLGGGILDWLVSFGSSTVGKNWEWKPNMAAGVKKLMK